MAQELIQELESHQFLPFRHVGGIFFEDADVGPEILPVLLAAGGLDQVAEIPFAAEKAHEPDVMGNGSIFQEDIFPPGPDFFLARCQREIGRQFRGDPHFFHIGFEIGQLPIHLLIALALGSVHIVQLLENHIEGLLEGVKIDDLLSGLIPEALYPEICIDQQQGFHR